MRHSGRRIFYGFFVVFFVGLLIAEVLHFSLLPKNIVMSYFVPDDVLLARNKRDVFTNKIKHLNVLAYAFLPVKPDGGIQAQGEDFDFFVHFEHPSSLKKIFSLGGADDPQSFFYALAHEDHFVASARDIVHTLRLSGLDLDFEIQRPYTQEEARAYSHLMMQLRKALGQKQIISMTTIADPITLKSIGPIWKEINKNISFVSMMCYDFIAPNSTPAYTALASNLYLVPSAPHGVSNAYISCDASIRYLISLGVDARKIVLGIPVYGVSYGGVSRKDNGLFQAYQKNDSPIFDDMGHGLLRYSTISKLEHHGFEKHFLISNDHVNGVWIYDPSTLQFITFDSPESVRAKASYVLKNHLAGMMMWRMGQDLAFDDEESLLKAMVERLF